MSFEANQVEVEKVFLDAAKSRDLPKWKLEDYIGGQESKLVYLNMKIPLVRATLKKGFSFSDEPIQNQWKIWDHIWNHSPYFEVMLGALGFAGKRPIEELFSKRQTLFRWLNRVDNWAHSDELSSLYAKLLEYNQKAVRPTYEKWNKSKNPWCRRQSMVGLLYYSRARKVHLPPKEMLRFVDRHLGDDHYYVQKGIGWTLRECWNIAPELTFKYLMANAHLIPSAGWTAATEKLGPADKAKLKKLRAEKRTRSSGAKKIRVKA